ncbi:AAWKG family protein [Streptomyces sp. NPDC004542]|uniref:AAWKG family protein n=1 Tax=Streptomyces sp. NPDC004542 TaxID=3154281 RepID=UPI00339EE6D6
MADDTTTDDDYWARAVTLFTGFPMPSRGELFEKLKSKEGVPLFRHQVDTLPPRPLEDGEMGRNVRAGEDYDLLFYTSSGGDGAHRSVKMHRVRIVLIGVVADAKGRATLFGENDDPMGDQWDGGNTFTGIGGEQWDASAMARYVFGGRRAIGALVNNYSTQDFSYAGQRVPDSDAVDLGSFERTAQAFDRAKTFFADHADELDRWEKALGAEDAAWRGKAAGVFRGLIKQLHRNYSSYVDQLGGKAYKAANLTLNSYWSTSTVGDALARAQFDLRSQGRSLQYAWSQWAATGSHDPHKIVVDRLNELGNWLITNNIKQVFTRQRRVNGQSGGYDADHMYTVAAFRQTHPEYGDLTKPDAWKRLGEAAVTEWKTTQDSYLEETARSTLSTLQTRWRDASEAAGAALRTVGTSTLTAMWQKDEDQLSREEAEKQKEEAEKQGNSIKDAMDGLNQGLKNFGNDVSESMNKFGEGVADGLNQTAKGIGESVTDGLNQTAKGIGENVTGLNDSLKDFGNGLNDNLKDFGNGLNGNLSDLVGADGSDQGDGTTEGNSTDTIRNPDGSTTKLNPDGSLVTTYPDGTVSLLNPSTGALTTTSPDGKSTTTPVDRGKAVTNPDGSTTTLNPDGSLTTKYPDGTVQTIAPDGTVTTTDPDGTVHSAQLNPAPGTVTTPGGGTTRLNPDGSLTTTYPDGSKETIDPSKGLVTTTSSDGTSHTDHLTSGQGFTNPDGSTTTLNPDGSLTTKYPDGTVQTIAPDGTVTTTQPDGTVDSTQLNPAPGTVTGPDGSTTRLNADGTLTKTFPDGSKEVIDPSKGTVTTTAPDGATHTDQLASGKPLTNPDGSTTVLNPDGSLTTKYQDGTVQTIAPDGTVTTTAPDGTVTTSDLDGTPAGSGSSDGSGSSGKGGTAGGSGTGGDTSGLNDDLPVPSPSSLGDQDFRIPDFGGGLSTTPLNPNLAGLGGTGDTPAGGAGSWEEYDSTPYNSGSLGAPTDEPAGETGGSSDTQAADGGVPLNPMAFGGMGAMGGMGGMGGSGGAGGSNGERVRSVLSDGDGAALRRRSRARTGAADEEEDVVITRGGRPVTTSTPYAPMGLPGGQGGRATESGDRVRSAWVPEEDDDVWGTDEGGAPAVIGR